MNDLSKKDDPVEIAKYLIKQYGLKEASTRASRSAYEAQEAGQLYELSVWRDVRRIIYGELDAARDRDKQA